MVALWAELSVLGMAVLGVVHGLELMEATPIILAISGGEERCVADTVRRSGTTHFEFRAISGEDWKTDALTFTFEGPEGSQWSDTLTETMKPYAVGNGKGGRYEMCFHSRQKKDLVARVEVKQTTLETPHGPNEDIDEKMQPVMTMLESAKEVAKNLKTEYEESDKLEGERKQHDERLRSRINKLAMFTVVVLVAASGWQLLLLNKFFRSKKLI